MSEIARKLDIDNTMVAGLIALQNAGEERLLDAATSGRIPLGVAMDIAKADSVETQRELLKAYETKQLNQVSIRTVKRLIDQRRFAGKQRDTGIAPDGRRLTSAESLVNAYRRESQKQKLMIRKAKICDAKAGLHRHGI
jgi:ParB family transcriptional regulator, chromosome partitioning protein